MNYNPEKAFEEEVCSKCKIRTNIEICKINTIYTAHFNKYLKQQNEQMLEAMIKSYKSECNASSCKDCLFINDDCPARILSLALEKHYQKPIEEILKRK